MKFLLCTAFTLCSALSPLLAQKEEAAKPAPAPAPSAAPAAETPAAAPAAAKAGKGGSIKAGDLTLKADESWEPKAEPRMMSLGGFSFLKEGKPVADADVFFMGGNVASNINRWQTQFKPGADGKPVPAKQTKLKYGADQAVLVEIKGTFMSGSMLGPKTDKAGQTMFGIIIERKDGSVFVKMVGDDAHMESARAAFRKLLDSAFTVPGVEVKEDAKAEETK